MNSARITGWDCRSMANIGYGSGWSNMNSGLKSVAVTSMLRLLIERPTDCPESAQGGRRPERQAVSEAAVSATQPPAPDVIAPRPGEELDAAAVGRYLEGKIPGAQGAPVIWQFPGGHANLMYLVAYPSARYVLRRPPHGDIPASAHDMGREYRVLSVLYRGFPPAPRAYFYCDDPTVIGAPFFVMERRHGVVVRREVPAQFGGGKDPEQNRKLSTVMID